MEAENEQVKDQFGFACFAHTMKSHSPSTTKMSELAPIEKSEETKWSSFRTQVGVAEMAGFGDKQHYYVTVTRPSSG